MGQALSLLACPTGLAPHSPHQSGASSVRDPEKRDCSWRQRKEALDSPVNKEERSKGWSWFRSAGSMKGKANALAIEGKGSCFTHRSL